ncbi:MAG TPA: alpha-ketoglutarate-dependent dioxygenase AlkB [Chthoniobacterales bacterium]|nr:alpha-ketoglutarate-dependent dioxygenase AlkB [Chthoniobacterales bacterium]
MTQIQLLPEDLDSPPGFLYRPDLISPEEEKALSEGIGKLELVAPTMHGVAAKRRTAHFGRSYEFATFKLGAAPPIPDFLLELRDRVATLTSAKSVDFGEALVTEYSPGAQIGWHRDAPQFGIVAGVSLLSACAMKFRPWPVNKTAGPRTRPLSHPLAPRSAYVLDGEARSKWQHHIPPARELRYSITFRTLRGH